MKKLVVMGLALTMALGITACSGGEFFTDGINGSICWDRGSHLNRDREK